MGIYYFSLAHPEGNAALLLSFVSIISSLFIIVNTSAPVCFVRHYLLLLVCFFSKLWENAAVQVVNQTYVCVVSGEVGQIDGFARLCCWNSWSQAQAAALQGALHGSCASSAASAAPRADLTAVHLGTAGRVAEFGSSRRTGVGGRERKNLEPCKNSSSHLRNEAS